MYVCLLKMHIVHQVFKIRCVALAVNMHTATIIVFGILTYKTMLTHLLLLRMVKIETMPAIMFLSSKCCYFAIKVQKCCICMVQAAAP